ncbi:Condensation domain protein [Nostoc sp. NIES-4103]|nr:Condensation domain protein [Nostoc sp. NIES-4103]
MKLEDVEDIYTLSPTQQGMLFHILAEPNSGIYLEQILCILQGKLNFSAFEKAWQQIVKRHPSLRTGFISKNLDKPVQVVYRRVKLVIEQYDWQNFSNYKQKEQLNTFLELDRQRGFQLSEPPLMRLTLIRIDQEVYQLIWTTYHLILDGWCTDILLKEFFALYEAFCRDDSLQLQPCRPYRDYIAWLKKQDLSATEAFWRQKLTGFKKPTYLAINRSFNYGEKDNYAQQQIQLSANITTALKSFAKHHHLTLNTLFIGAWALLLSHYSKEKDIVFGTVVSGRPVTLPGIESIVGLFVNTLPTRVQISPQDSLVPWLKTLQSQYNQLRQYEHTPLINIQSWSELSGGLPLFESLLACQNSLVNFSRIQTTSLKVDNIHFNSRSNYPLTLVMLLGSELTLVAQYNLSRFQTTAITRMLGHFEAVFNSMVAEPYLQLNALTNLLNELEKKEKASDFKKLKNFTANKLKIIQPKAIELSNTKDY